MIPAASGATVPKVCTWAITSSARELRARKSDCELTPSLLLLLSSDLHLRLVQHEVGLHLLDGLVRDVKAELLRVRGRPISAQSSPYLLSDGQVKPQLPPGTEPGLAISTRSTGSANGHTPAEKSLDISLDA
jgi:hypothetical protein